MPDAPPTTSGPQPDDASVSCRLTAILLQDAARRGESLERLAHGTGHPVERLLDSDARVGWDALRTLLRNLADSHGPSELEALGRCLTGPRAAGPYVSLARLVDDPALLYRAMGQPVTSVTGQLVACLHPRLREISPRHMELDLLLEPGREPSEELWHVARGGLSALSTLAGWPPSRVEVEPVGGGARFSIRMAERPSAWRRLARALRLPFAVRAAAREILWIVSRTEESYRRLATAAADRQNAESRRVDTEERFRTFFQSSPVPMALVRVRDGRMLDLNARFLALSGRRRDDALGQTIYDMASELDVSVKPEEWRPFLERLAHGESLQDFEVRYQGPDGAVRYLSVYGEGVPVEGDPCAVFQILDVSDRRHAEQVLRESERTYFEFYENAPDLYISVDATTGAILRCNRKFCETLGLRKQEVIGLPFERILDPADAERSRRALRALRTTGKLRNVMLRAKRRNGSTLEVSASASAVRGSDGRVRLSRVILRDLSRARPEPPAERSGAQA